MSFLNGFDLNHPSSANGDHREHAKKDIPQGTLLWAKTHIKISRLKKKKKNGHFPLGSSTRDKEGETVNLSTPLDLTGHCVFFLLITTHIRRSSYQRGPTVLYGLVH